jgi:hypothetical protein
MGKVSKEKTCGSLACDFCDWLDSLGQDQPAREHLRGEITSWEIYDRRIVEAKTAQAIARQDAVFAEL